MQIYFIAVVKPPARPVVFRRVVRCNKTHHHRYPRQKPRSRRKQLTEEMAEDALRRRGPAGGAGDLWRPGRGRWCGGKAGIQQRRRRVEKNDGMTSRRLRRRSRDAPVVPGRFIHSSMSSRCYRPGLSVRITHHRHRRRRRRRRWRRLLRQRGRATCRRLRSSPDNLVPL